MSTIDILTYNKMDSTRRAMDYMNSRLSQKELDEQEAFSREYVLSEIAAGQCQWQSDEDCSDMG